MSFQLRMRSAGKAASFHLLGSLVVALLAAIFVFLVWYPHPYGLLSGGRKLFLVLVSVDVVCGPLLTLILFSPKKPRREIWTDMALVITIQLAALVYGLHMAYQARPLFLVHEVDRFRVINLQDYLGEDLSKQLDALPRGLKPGIFDGPVTVGVRDPISREERHEVMLDSVAGGRDYSQRPDFYVPYDSAYQSEAVQRARPLSGFVERFQDTATEANKIVTSHGTTVEDAVFLPVLHKQDWIAVLDTTGRILGFLPGDGFSVPVKR